MNKNVNLHKAKKAKNDEFYTRLEDIELELSNYSVEYFKDKVIYCPCDVGVEGLDIPKSNFIKYFEDNKDRLGYKKLIHTSLQEGFDYRSDYCQKLFKEADVVVTNPPFSLFRDFVACLEQHNLKYIIMGNKNALTFKDIFPLIRDNKLWLGVKSWASDMYFNLPKEQEDYFVENKKEGSGYVVKNGKVLGRASAIWFTNIDIDKRHEKLILYKNYTPEEYPKYDNYDAINVDKVKDIPCDYNGVMGVPISFLDKFNPDQFEIVAFRKGDDGKDLVFTRDEEREFNNTFKKKVQPYFRILVRRR